MGRPPEELPQVDLRGPALGRWLAWGIYVLLGAAILAIVLRDYTIRHAPIHIAAHNTLTGRLSTAGLEAVEAQQLYIDEVNRKGGIDGHPIKLVRFDDQGSAEVAHAGVKSVVDSGCLAVLGHRLSITSLAAGEGYKAAGIPALTGTTHVDELTIDNPWYFRAQNTASTQGRSIAEYLRILMDTPFVHLVASPAKFDLNFARGFAEAYDPKRVRQWSFDSDPEARSASVNAMAEQLAEAPEAGVIILGTGDDSLPDAIMAVRRQGITGLVIAAGGAGHQEFLHRFDDEPEEKQQPGFFARNLYAVAPLIFDSAGAKAQAFAAAYTQKTGRTPGWIAASAYEAAQLMVEAVRRAKVRNRPNTIASDRQGIRDALASIDSRERGVPGFLRTLYFDAQHNMPRPIRLGLFREGRFVSVPEQLVEVQRPDLLDLEQEMQQGHIVESGDRYYWLQRVVYAGIDINRLNRLDMRDGSFNVDLNLWMRYSGDDDAPTHVEFPALLDRSRFDYEKPVEDTLEGGLNYRLYRIAGDFKSTFDLHEYPFDDQQLLIRFQNRQQRHELVTYVVDSPGLNLSTGNRVVPADWSPYAAVQQWHLAELRYFVDFLSSNSSLGKPSLFSDNARIEFAGFNLAIVLQRNAEIYVIKTMIPLMLLVLVVLATLFLPGNLFRERINIPVTAILTSAVLLLSVNNQLGDIGYTISLEYIFYAFFGLCLASMLIGIAHDALSVKGRDREALLLARTGQVFYVFTVAAVIAYYWWRYGR